MQDRQHQDQDGHANGKHELRSFKAGRTRPIRSQLRRPVRARIIKELGTLSSLVTERATIKTEELATAAESISMCWRSAEQSVLD
jgi:hypothetical protein